MADQPQGKDTPDQPDASQPTPPADGAKPAASEDASVDEALEAASASLNEIKATVESSTGEQDLAAEGSADGDESVPVTSLDLLGDVELDVMIELGRTEMLVEDVLKLQAGSVVELDKLAGDPVDVYVNGRLVARGEVLVLNDNFCIRISEVLADLEQEAEAAAEAQQIEAAPER